MNDSKRPHIMIMCECGKAFDLPVDCTPYMEGMNCGECATEGKFKVQENKS